VFQQLSQDLLLVRGRWRRSEQFAGRHPHAVVDRTEKQRGFEQELTILLTEKSVVVR